MLRSARDHRDDGQREFEQAEGQHAFRAHREKDGRLARRFARCWRAHGFAQFLAAHQFAQALTLSFRKIAQSDLVLAARPGFEPHLGQAEQAGEEFLFQADVLYPLIGHGTRAARQKAALDPDIRFAHRISKASPAGIGDGEIERDDGDDDRREKGKRAGLFVLRDREGEEAEGEDQLAEHGHAAHGEAQPVGSPRVSGCRRRAARARLPARVRRHCVSRRIAARIVSRMASASSCLSPGSVTEALWLPAVWTVSVAIS